jgi:hypothetical protein
VREQHLVAARVTHIVGDLNDQQSRLFFTVNSFLAAYQGDGLHTLFDDDIEEAMDALAATYETAARGVIYDHQPASRTAERLVRELRPLMTESRRRFASSFEAAAAVVLRRIAETVRELRAAESPNRRAYLELARTIVRLTDEAARADESGAPVNQPDAPRLIVP